VEETGAAIAMQVQDRRQFLALLGGLGATAGGLVPAPSRAAPPDLIRRAVPKTGEKLPVIGMGSWITFNVGDDAALRDDRVAVLRTFFDRGGAVIDSSPMYGSSEAVIGYCLARLENDAALFAATKVWTPFQWLGKKQMAESEALWGTKRFDLMQVHNLVDWEAHLETLTAWKAQGRVRYIGMTTSHGERHAEMERIMRTQPIDFVQLTYNILDREAEARLLPLAAERRLGVIANRPFRGGNLIDRFQRYPLPPWATEFGAASWPQFLLKFIVSHPAVTCAIPATSRVDHMRENMGALHGRLPDPALRQRMIRHVEAL
jgi:aryl-alcohol dehydrogenase-like predicted oxidoreductase